MLSTPIPLVAAASMGADVYTNGIWLRNMNLYSIQAVWTGSPVGSIQLEISDDPVPLVSSPLTANPAANVVNWSLFSGTNIVVTGAGSYFWRVGSVSELWVRCHYIYTSGSGSLLVQAMIKGS